MNENTHSLELFKTQTDDLQVEYEIIPAKSAHAEEINEIDDYLEKIENRLSELDGEIDRLTNHADGIDYTVAVASGIIAGLVDSFFVGEINWEKEYSAISEKFNKLVVRRAGLDADVYSKLSDSEKTDYLKNAIQKLEKKYPLPSDNVWKTPGKGNSVSSAMRHHIDDFCHHPTPLGFLACIISVLFKTAFFVDDDGTWHFRWAKTDPKDMVWLWGCIIATAFLQWLVCLTEKKYKEEQFEEMPKPLRILLRALASAPVAVQVLKRFNEWSGHLCSDIAGSSQTPGAGMGIPGLLLSSLKEALSIPPLNKIPGLHKQLDFLFDKGFDARAEATVLRIAGKQMLPVLLNEIIVRGFYFVRRFVCESRLHGENWKDYSWDKILPFNNRTIVRMLTIAHGTFVAVDLADAAVRSAIKNGTPHNPKFWTDFVMRVNFVGVGRFTIAVFSEAAMGLQRHRKEAERIDLNSKMLNFYQAKIYYKQADMWIAAEKAELATQEMYQTAQNAVSFFADAFRDMKDDLSKIGSYGPGIDENNPGLSEILLSELEDL